ncbi:MAG TPA: hypothetical protein VMO88_17040, partial [Acidimicrobiales bacterium]|nr:hypothetical protein [Acidimicrobiales bacterium]
MAIAAATFTAPALTLVIAANPAEAAGGGSVVPGQPTLSNPVAGGGSDYTIPFTTSASGTVASGGTITIVAPTGTHFPTCMTGCTNYTLTVATNAPVQATSISSPSPNQVIITVPSTIGANTAVTVVVNSVSNPTTASSSYTLQESTTGDTTAATSPAFAVNAGAPAFVVATGGDNQSAQISTQFPQQLVATVTDSFGNPETPAGDTILFQAPASGASASFTGGGNSDSVLSANGNYTSHAL